MIPLLEISIREFETTMSNILAFNGRADNMQVRWVI